MAEHRAACKQQAGRCHTAQADHNRLAVSLFMRGLGAAAQIRLRCRIEGVRPRRLIIRMRYRRLIRGTRLLVLRGGLLLTLRAVRLLRLRLLLSLRGNGRFIRCTIRRLCGLLSALLRLCRLLCFGLFHIVIAARGGAYNCCY